MGRASQVTDLGDGTVLRVGGIRSARRGSWRWRDPTGIPFRPFAPVRADALVLERIDGPTMWADLQRRPWRSA